MTGETTLTLVGNLTADPELRYTQNGLAVANFTVASTPRTFDRASNDWKDGDALFMRCSVWREFAEHVAGSLTKGMRVIVTGSLVQRNYETKEGERRTSMELRVDEIGPSLRYATASVQRTQRSDSPQQRTPRSDASQINDEAWFTGTDTQEAHTAAGGRQQEIAPDPWNGQANPAFADETPF